MSSLVEPLRSGHENRFGAPQNREETGGLSARTAVLERGRGRPRLCCVWQRGAKKRGPLSSSGPPHLFSGHPPPTKRRNWMRPGGAHRPFLRLQDRESHNPPPPIPSPSIVQAVRHHPTRGGGKFRVRLPLIPSPHGKRGRFLTSPDDPPPRCSPRWAGLPSGAGSFPSPL